jgi:hypothetical protein
MGCSANKALAKSDTEVEAVKDGKESGGIIGPPDCKIRRRETLTMSVAVV